MIHLPNLILGVDPGLSGAFCLVEPTDTKDQLNHQLTSLTPRNPKIVECWDTPIKPKNQKHELDLDRLNLQIEKYSKQIKLCLIEEVGVMTGKEGRVSMFNFGRGFGQIEGILSSYFIPIFYTKPAVWKLSIGLGRDKNLSRTKASTIFPDHSHLFKRVKDDGRAEAALLAYIGSRFRV